MKSLVFLLLLLPLPHPAAFPFIGMPPHYANATSLMLPFSPSLEAAVLLPPFSNELCVATSSSIGGGNITLVVVLVQYPTSKGFLSTAIYSRPRNVSACATTIAMICPGTVSAAAVSLPPRRKTRQAELESNSSFTLPVPDNVPSLPTTMVPSPPPPPPPPPAAPRRPLTPLGPKRESSSGTRKMKNLHLARVRILAILLHLLLSDPGEGQQVIFDGINQ